MKDLPPVSKLVDRLGFSTTAVYVQLYDLYRKQRKRQSHFHAGRYWIRMPYEDFPRMFPELTADAVSRAIGKLEDEGSARNGPSRPPQLVYDSLKSTSACRPENVIY